MMRAHFSISVLRNVSSAVGVARPSSTDYQAAYPNTAAQTRIVSGGAIGKIQTSHCLCNDCRFCADMIVETQIDGHLDLVTATLARPYMTDFVVAHVCRPLWCDQ
jgi:hypothetical protein